MVALVAILTVRGAARRVLRLAVVVGMIGGAPEWSPAQQRTHLTGTVAAADGRGIAGVVVSIRETGDTVITDGTGTFRLPGLAEGSYILAVANPQYLPKQFRFALADGQADQHLGTIVLERRPDGTVRVFGRISDAQTGDAVASAIVRIGDAPRSTTDDGGGYSVIATAPARGQETAIRIERIGYDPLIQTIALPNDPDVNIDIALRPSAVALADIVVEGEETQVPAFLRGFYERKERGAGTHFTADDVERLKPSRVADLMRRVPGLSVLEDDGPLQAPAYRFGTSGFFGCLRANLFIDGVLVSPESFDVLLQPERIAGVEVYDGIATPIQYDVPNGTGQNGCGAVVAWTKPPGFDGAPRSAPVNLGLYVGGPLAGIDGGGRRIGGQLSMPIRGPFSLGTGFHFIDDQQLSGETSWQFLLSLRAEPLGRNTPWYVGGGLAVLREGGGRPRSSHPFLLTGARLGAGPLQPFGELQFILRSGLRQNELSGLIGLSLRLGG